MPGGNLAQAEQQRCFGQRYMKCDNGWQLSFQLKWVVIQKMAII